MIDKVKVIEDLCNVLKQVQELENQLDKVVGCHSDALLFVTIDNVSNLLIEQAAQLAQIPTEAILWFIYENDMGARGFAARNEDGLSFVISNIEEFVRFEEQS